MTIELIISAVCAVPATIVFINLTRQWSKQLLFAWLASYGFGLILALTALAGPYRLIAVLLAIWNGIGVVMVGCALVVEWHRPQVGDHEDCNTWYE